MKYKMNVNQSKATASPVSDDGMNKKVLSDSVTKKQRSFSGPTNIGTLNVRTLLQSGQQGLLAKTLCDRNMDICCLSETRIPNEGIKTLKVPMKNQGFKLYYSGPVDGSGHHGVGIAISNRFRDSVVSWRPISERLAIMRLRCHHMHITVMSLYAPTSTYSDGEAEDFFAMLDAEIDAVPAKDFLVVAGDYNAQLGSDVDGTIAGHHTFGHLDRNGSLLIEMALMHKLVISNTMFCHKTRHLQTWLSPGGRMRYQMDHILVRQKFRSHLIDSRSFWGIDVITDHALVWCKVEISPIRYRRQRYIRQLDVNKLRCEETANAFVAACEESFKVNLKDNVDGSAFWTQLQSCIHDGAAKTIGYRKNKRNDWIGPRTLELSRQRKMACANNDQVQARLLACQIKRQVRHDKEYYWNRKAVDLEEASDKGDTKRLYQLMKELAGKYVSPVSETIQTVDNELLCNKEEKLERWRQHFDELLNHASSTVSMDIVQTYNGSGLPVSDYDISIGPPSLEEIYGAVNNLKNGKAAGMDGLPPELFKAGVSVIAPQLQLLFEKIWIDELIPGDWEMAIVIPMHKKGDKRLCKNYRGISLLNIVYKILERVLLNRMLRDRDMRTREGQAGFRPGRGCIDQIFTIRQILELRHEFRRETHIAFIDFVSAFDSVNRDCIWAMLRADGVPLKICRILETLYRTTRCCIRAYGGYSTEFLVNTGVRQGGILSPLLFNICMDHILRVALDGRQGGIRLHPSGGIITDLTFADDVALLADSREDLQGMLDRISQESRKIGLVISSEKTKYLHSPTMVANNLMVDSGIIEEVDFFTYLGSQLAITGGAPQEIAVRVRKAAGVFGMLSGFWSRKDVHYKTKLRIYCTTVRPTLLYGCETWPIRVEDCRRLEVFENRCLRRILNIRMPTQIHNVELRKRCETMLMDDIVRNRRWRWIGHVLRMSEDRLPRMAFTSSGGSDWKRPRGGVCKTMKRLVQKEAESIIMRPLNLSRKRYNQNWIEHLDVMAGDRCQWRALLGNMKESSLGADTQLGCDRL